MTAAMAMTGASPPREAYMVMPLRLSAQTGKLLRKKRPSAKERQAAETRLRAPRGLLSTRA